MLLRAENKAIDWAPHRINFFFYSLDSKLNKENFGMSIFPKLITLSYLEAENIFPHENG